MNNTDSGIRKAATVTAHAAVTGLPSASGYLVIAAFLEALDWSPQWKLAVGTLAAWLMSGGWRKIRAVLLDLQVLSDRRKRDPHDFLRWK